MIGLGKSLMHDTQRTTCVWWGCTGIS
jgi:hypothetical protein